MPGTDQEGIMWTHDEEFDDLGVDYDDPDVIKAYELHGELIERQPVEHEPAAAAPIGFAEWDRLTHVDPAPLTDDPGNALYAGRMTAFPDPPDEDLF
jgi:hypothetical protein